jgi:hypothetical protein
LSQPVNGPRARAETGIECDQLVAGIDQRGHEIMLKIGERKVVGFGDGLDFFRRGIGARYGVQILAVKISL